MLKDAYPYYLANEAVYANEDLTVTNKYTTEPACKVALAGADVIDRAIDAAVEAQKELNRWPAYRRRAVLEHVVNGIEARFEEFAHALAVEAGKPIKDARGETMRGIDTFRIAMEESTRLEGRYESLEISDRAEGYESIWKHVPIGPCSFISPFNFPLNLAAHKMAPAIAVGCSWVLKPASKTPISALIVGDILSETDLPRGAFSILPCSRDGADLFTTDDRFKLLSFTGSPSVGWDLKARAGKKPVVLELGGNAACIVDRDADIEYATDRLIHGAFYQSGQSCIGVQRIVIHADIYDELVTRFVEKIKALKAGDPLDEETFLGPIISEGDAKRLEQWTNEAVEAGGRLVVGGKRDGVMFDATLVENVPRDQKLSCDEAFGPVATLSTFTDFQDAIDEVNDSVFGLQAGVFTRDIHHAFKAFNEIEAGGVVINDVPSMRVDSMPYGGVKESGLGREGVRFAMEDMTEIRLMVLNRIGK
ncbi:MAG: aldehyde dehydrogenase family protein [Phycisphaerales bacterium]